MFDYVTLSPETATEYASMTYDRYRSYLATEANEHVRFVRIGARLDEKPVGLLFGQINHQTRQSGVLSLYTLPMYRNQGVATGLVRAYERWLIEQNSPSVAATYTTQIQSLPIVEHILSKCGWDAPERLNTVVYIPASLAHYENFVQTPMGQLGYNLPESYHYIGWLEISEGEMAALRERIEATVPPDESPFGVDDTPIDPSSVAILCEGQVVAWMLNHRVASGRLRFSILYLDSQHRGQKLGIKLVNEAVRRSFVPFTADQEEMYIFQTRLENDLMQAYIQAIGVVVSQTEELRLMRKGLT